MYQKYQNLSQSAYTTYKYMGKKTEKTFEHKMH